MTTVIGIDPGPTPGIVLLEFHQGALHTREAVQCTAGALYDVLHGLNAGVASLVAVEKFVVARGSMRSGQSGDITREQVARLSEHHAGRFVERRATDVKPWATDDRLAHAGLLEPTKGMRHARDAARHALFAAVKDGGLPDPLSRKARP